MLLAVVDCGHLSVSRVYLLVGCCREGLERCSPKVKLVVLLFRVGRSFLAPPISTDPPKGGLGGLWLSQQYAPKLS